jgi:hypothetical protein
VANRDVGNFEVLIDDFLSSRAGALHDIVDLDLAVEGGCGKDAWGGGRPLVHRKKCRSARRKKRKIPKAQLLEVW